MHTPGRMVGETVAEWQARMADIDRRAARAQIDTSVEKRQAKLAKNSEQTDKYMLRLFATVRRLEQLRNERNRLLGPKHKRTGKVRKMTLDEIRERCAAGGDEFNDEIPS